MSTTLRKIFFSVRGAMAPKFGLASFDPELQTQEKYFDITRYPAMARLAESISKFDVVATDADDITTQSFQPVKMEQIFPPLPSAASGLIEAEKRFLRKLFRVSQHTKHESDAGKTFGRRFLSAADA